ncbi:MAG: NAD(P)/FAD-dependent oxidoreductase [Methylomonas sp.]|uniref:NAD(P)/FAD-dependent oxidoreductase n=1 Tax=Methylomonas sp. TaxID=418 RepID=UPI0025E36E45|nr:NAD(P)/FAD-dependent oxidoreductase [Methylomonas sp.]MCK9607596.1 NAD(P)/FAD-dependent oxidoreductase [Methylomonas sp.]
MSYTATADVLVIGAGASGLMCAIEAAKRGRGVCVLEHANRPGKKILMSGGGRCNFTNYTVEPEHYISHNPHFCKSALKRFNQWDFLALVQRYKISFHERLHGQLFCDNSAKDILDMLLAESRQHGVELKIPCAIQQVSHAAGGGFRVQTSQGDMRCQSLVVATGGLSIPKMGATPFGYQLAEQFGIKVWPTRAGLVPLTLQPVDKEVFSALTGIAVPCEVIFQNHCFKENLLFTHRGLSGPAILQISSYWQPGESLQINCLPDMHLFKLLKQQRGQGNKLKLKTWLADYLPKRLLQALIPEPLLECNLVDCSDKQLQQVANHIQAWHIKPNGSEGYRTAEVTLGGVDCDALSSKTMECLQVPGLFFIGEVVDVSGWLGGYNFQWAWSSGWCAGQYV